MLSPCFPDSPLATSVLHTPSRRVARRDLYWPKLQVIAYTTRGRTTQAHGNILLFYIHIVGERRKRAAVCVRAPLAAITSAPARMQAPWLNRPYTNAPDGG